jgi:DNA-binding CsgD family transcriptional regulator
METLSIEDIQNLSQCIQKLYTLHDFDTFGTSALSIVDRLVPTDIPLFTLTNTRTGQLDLTYLPNFSSLSPEVLEVLEQVLSQNRETHPIAKNMPLTLNGAYKLSDFVSQQELHALENLYQRFLRQTNIEDQMIFFLPDVTPSRWQELAQADTTLTGFIINRDRCSFVERDRTILNLLRPHLFQAYTNAQKYQQLQQNLSQVQQSLDCLDLIVLDTDGKIKSIAPQAIIWLETYFSKPTCASQLPDLLWSWVKHQIAIFTTQIDRPNACLPLRMQQAGKELIIRLVIEPSEAQYLLLLEEQKPSLLNSLAILGLSQRETEVLAWVLQGKDNQLIATQLNIGISTVRKHLENIYRKLGVQSRTEASVSALTKLGFLHSLPLI